MHDKIFIEINGARQGMFLQSENTENPVLLFLHGGAGSPEIALLKNIQPGWKSYLLFASGNSEAAEYPITVRSLHRK